MVKKKKIVSLKALQKEIEKEEAKRKRIEVKVAEQEKIKALQLKLKKLKKTPSQIRTEKLVKRTGRGLGRITKGVSAAAIRQAKRIRKQQLRDLADAQRKERTTRSTRKKSKKRRTTKRDQEDDFFTGPPGFGFGN